MMKLRYDLLDHGYVIHIDDMGTDQSIVDAARVSYDRNGASEDRALLRYLMRNRHTSPFEMCELKVELKMPMFVARQWVRHRTASLNEVSARYTQLPPEMFIPHVFQKQAMNNKQGRQGVFSPIEEAGLSGSMASANQDAYEVYENMLDQDVARETARGVLPLNTYTKFVWKIDLHNLMHFLKLRMDPHAQYEIRVYAEALYVMASDLWPLAMEAFDDYVLNAYTLSAQEIEVVRYAVSIMDGIGTDYFKGMTVREIKQFRDKFDLL